MNYIGFAVAMAFIIAMVTSGFGTPVRKILSKSLQDGLNMKKRVEYYLARTAAGPLAKILFCFAAVILVVTIDVIRTLNGPDVQNTSVASLWFYLIVAAVLLILTVTYGTYMLAGRARYQLDAHGEPLRYPTYDQDANGNYLDEDGNVLCYKAGGAPIKLDKLGRKLRYYQFNGQWRDAVTDELFVYPNGRPVALNAAGLLLRYTQDQSGNWFDGLDPIPTPMQTTPVNPDELLASTQQLDLKRVVDDIDLRIPHPLSDVPMIDENAPNRNRFGRVSLKRVITFITAAAVVLAIALGVLALSCGQTEIYRINNRMVTAEWGNTHLFDLAALLIGLDMAFILAIILPCLWAFRKSVKLVEFIASTFAGETLLALIQFTQENLSSKFKGVDLVDEDGVTKKIWNAAKAIALNALLFFTPVHLWTHWKVASFTLGLMLLRGLWDLHYGHWDGSDDITKKKRETSRKIWTMIGVGYTLVSLAALVDSVRNIFLLLLAQADNANEGTNAVLSGQKTIHFLGFWPLAGMALFGGLAFWLLIVVHDRLNDPEASWLQRNVAKYNGVLALGSIAVAATCLVLLAFRVAGISELAIPKAVAYRVPHTPPTAPVLGEVTLNASPSGLSITVGWKDTSDNETGFVVERQGIQTKDSPREWFKVGDVGPNNSSFRDAKLDPGTFYIYRVVAINEAGIAHSQESDWIEIPKASGPTVELVADATDTSKNKPAVTQGKHPEPSPADAEPPSRTASAKETKGYDPEYLANFRELNNGKDP